jgi:DNA-binding NtrC family response regulator
LGHERDGICSRVVRREFQQRPRRLTRSAVRFLEAGTWLGNVRELEFAVWTAYEIARHARAVGVEHLAAPERGFSAYAECQTREARLALVERALAQAGGRVEHAARLIGASRNTVGRWRRQLTRSDSGYRAAENATDA